MLLLSTPVQLIKKVHLIFPGGVILVDRHVFQIAGLALSVHALIFDGDQVAAFSQESLGFVEGFRAERLCELSEV